MDVRMPNLDGIEATRRLTLQADGPRVLVLTTFDRDEYLYGAMKAGASGFLLKDARRSQLIGAIRTVAGGDALVDPTITRRLIERYCQMPPQDGAPSAISELTPRELEVLKLVARGLYRHRSPQYQQARAEHRMSRSSRPGRSSPLERAARRSV